MVCILSSQEGEVMLSRKESTAALIVEITPQWSWEPCINVQAYMTWVLGGFVSVTGFKPTSPTVSCMSAINDRSSSVQVTSPDALNMSTHSLKNKPAVTHTMLNDDVLIDRG